jgi:hypothetical protein
VRRGWTKNRKTTPCKETNPAPLEISTDGFIPTRLAIRGTFGETASQGVIVKACSATPCKGSSASQSSQVHRRHGQRRIKSVPLSYLSILAIPRPCAGFSLVTYFEAGEWPTSANVSLNRFFLRRSQSCANPRRRGASRWMLHSGPVMVSRWLSPIESGLFGLASGSVNKSQQCELVHRRAQRGPLSPPHCSPYRYLQFSPASRPGFCIMWMVP